MMARQIYASIALVCVAIIATAGAPADVMPAAIHEASQLPVHIALSLIAVTAVYLQYRSNEQAGRREQDMTKTMADALGKLSDNLAKLASEDAALRRLIERAPCTAAQIRVEAEEETRKSISQRIGGSRQ